MSGLHAERRGDAAQLRRRILGALPGPAGGRRDRHAHRAGARRWLSDEALADLGEYLGLTVAELDSIATFYNMIFRKPVGRHVILVCDSFACWSLGYAELRAAVEAELGVGWARPPRTAASRCCRSSASAPATAARR